MKKKLNFGRSITKCGGNEMEILIGVIIIIPALIAAILKFRHKRLKKGHEWLLSPEYRQWKMHPPDKFAHWWGRTFLLWIIVWIPAFAGMTSGGLYAQPKTEQEWQEVRDRFYITMVRLESAEKVVGIQEEQILNLQERLGVKDTIINLQSLQLKARDEQIELFKQREARLEIPPVLKWRGFFPGVSFEYRFDSEVITQQTIIAGLKYDLTGSFKIEALGRLDLTV